MKFISIEDITEDMTFKEQKPYTRIVVGAKRSHKIVRDSEKNHIGIVFPSIPEKDDWERHEYQTVYFFWKQYAITRAISSRGF